MQTAFQQHSLRKPSSLLKCNLTEVMDKNIATIECAFQWFQLWQIARDDVSPVTFAILKWSASNSGTTESEATSLLPWESTL